MANRHNDIFGSAAAAPAQRGPSNRPADSDIFGARQNAAPSQPSARAPVNTVFPGMSGEDSRATPRGDHGCNILDSKIDLGGGFGNAQNNYERPATSHRRSAQENAMRSDSSAGARSGKEHVIVKQTESNNIFGASNNALREANTPVGVPDTAGMKGNERRNAIAAWRNGKAGN
ncbi:hypothetical protein T492DRAFT_971009 [Pavlovales sp. CCMP2436]|nr:hypothetical protein T492DRAFT_971009 [Pavlovales sp. CCMP2436]